MCSNHWVMNCKQETYKRLGDYIREVDVRNNENKLSENDLYGVSVTKEFIPTHANLVGVQFHNYKVVKQKQFTYIPDTSRRGDKIALALNLFGKDIIVSNVYTTFEVDENQLLPEYLMMWFRRSEFDRYARFKSHGSAREVFDWEEMCNVMLPIPAPIEQQRIIDQYNAIQKRIENNKQTIAKLEEAAQAIYRKMFVDELTPKGTVKDLCKSFSGFPFDGESYSTECGTVALRGENVTEKSLRWDTVKRYNGVITERITNYYLKDWDIVIGMDGSKVGKNWSFIHNNNLPLLLAQRVACLRCDSIEKQVFLFLAIQTEHFVEYVSRVNTGSTILHISTSQIDDFPIPIPSEQQFLLIREKIVPIFQYIQFRTQENELLSQIKSLFNDTIV